MDTTKTLRSDVTRPRHFLIPNTAGLSSSDFELRTVTGYQNQVDPKALATYGITHGQVRAWLNGQFDQVVDSAREAIIDFIRKKMTVEPDAWFGKARNRAACKCRNAVPNEMILLQGTLVREYFPELIWPAVKQNLLAMGFSK